MEKLKSDIRDLLPKVHFLSKDVLDRIEKMIDSFSNEELGRIYELLSETKEKTTDYFCKLLQKNPRFFEQARMKIIHKKEEKSSEEEAKEIANIISN